MKDEAPWSPTDFHTYNGDGHYSLNLSRVREALGISNIIHLGRKRWLLNSSTLYGPFTPWNAENLHD